jgi:hypothetical protein
MAMEQPFDDSAKNFYQRFFTDLGMRTTTQYEVFSRSRSIDILVECAVEDLPKLHDTVFNHFRRVNVLELLLLARGAKLEQFIELCVAEGLVEYLQLTLDIGVSIDPNTVWRKIMEVMNMKVTIREDTWPYIDEFFQKVPEAFQKLPTLQEAFAEHAKQATIQSRQQTLFLILSHRFGQIPSEVTQQIERMNDLQLLNQWIEQALDAETINQINFTGAPQT